MVEQIDAHYSERRLFDRVLIGLKFFLGLFGVDGLVGIKSVVGFSWKFNKPTPNSIDDECPDGADIWITDAVVDPMSKPGPNRRKSKLRDFEN